MWYGPVTSCAWFDAYGKTGKGSRSGNSSSLPGPGGQRGGYSEKPKPRRMAEHRHSPGLRPLTIASRFQTSDDIDSGFINNPNRSNRKPK